MSNENDLSSKKLLSRKETAAYIGVGLTNIYHLMKCPDFPPPTRIGGLVFFKRELIDAWIDENTKK